MGDERFDEMTKALAATTTRRQALKVAAATAFAGALSLVGAGEASAARCRRVGQPCRENAECCGFFEGETVCPPQTGRCACRPGANFCRRTRRCVVCPPNSTFNPETCECVCAPGTTPCDGACCTEEQTCCVGFYGGQCCPPGEICCEGGFCSFEGQCYYYGG